VCEAMQRDCGLTIDALRVDGGVTANELCMQMQADLLGAPVTMPADPEVTARGAAQVAGLGAGLWTSAELLRADPQEQRKWQPNWPAEQRRRGRAEWSKAVSRTLDWVDVG
jgi:glycerol kinase